MTIHLLMNDPNDPLTILGVTVGVLLAVQWARRKR